MRHSLQWLTPPKLIEEMAALVWRWEILASVSQSVDVAFHFMASASQFLTSESEYDSAGRSSSRFKGFCWTSSKYASRSHFATRYSLAKAIRSMTVFSLISSERWVMDFSRISWKSHRVDKLSTLTHSSNLTTGVRSMNGYKMRRKDLKWSTLIPSKWIGLSRLLPSTLCVCVCGSANIASKGVPGTLKQFLWTWKSVFSTLNTTIWKFKSRVGDSFGWDITIEEWELPIAQLGA